MPSGNNGLVEAARQLGEYFSREDAKPLFDRPRCERNALSRSSHGKPVPFGLAKLEPAYMLLNNWKIQPRHGPVPPPLPEIQIIASAQIDISVTTGQESSK